MGFEITTWLLECWWVCYHTLTKPVVLSEICGPLSTVHSIFQIFAGVRDGNTLWCCPCCMALAGPVMALLPSIPSPMSWAESMPAWWHAYPVSSFEKDTGGTQYSCFHPAVTHSELKYYDSWRSFSSMIHLGPLFTIVQKLVISRCLDLAKKT